MEAGPWKAAANGETCKKARKDDDPPSKTITNYFSPVSKPVEKVLSSPRSSNIADYFIRNSPVVGKECTPSYKSTSPDHTPHDDLAKNSHTPPTPLTGSTRAAGRLRKQAKRTRLSKRLIELDPNDADDGDNSPPATQICGSMGIMGSDTAALLAEICSKSEDLDEDAVPKSTRPASSAAKTQQKERSLSRKNNVLSGPTSEPVDPMPPLTHTNVISHSKSTMEDSSLEVQVDSSSGSVLTISFDEFLKSQKESDQTPSTTKSQVDIVDSPGIPETNNPYDTDSGVQQPSPKTMTVQAQVHLSPPLPNSCSPTRAPAKIASIFQKKKGAEAKKKGDQPVSGGADPVIQKRKSNVVVEEEDLELAVIDVEATENAKPKSTVAERQQFMKAFRQAGDATKTTGRKSNAKKKEPNTEGSDEHNQECGGKTPTQHENEECQVKNKTKELGKGTISKGDVKKPKGSKSDKPSTSERKAKPKPQTHEATESPMDSSSPQFSRSPIKRKPKSRPQVMESPQDSTSPGLRRTTSERKAKPKLQAKKVTEAPQDDKKSRLRTTTSERTAQSKLQSDEVTETSQDTTSPGLRRSLRRQKCEADIGSPSQAVNDDPVSMSTPKAKVTSGKSGVYRAEMLTSPSETESPIRMRFTRLPRRSGGRQFNSISDDAFTPARKRLSANSKKIKKAKQLLEKAKALQQSITKAETPQRRSVRQQKRKSQDPIMVDDISNTPIIYPKEEKKSNLRSLNDVLGKKVKSTPAGQKEFLNKAAKSGIITLDDGSEASENSQDDEQFKAKREFLMSGLPDSLRRHIAKTTALREAYFLSSSSFQTVVHVQQRDGCVQWNLAMPLCPLLREVAAVSLDASHATQSSLSIGDFTSCSKSRSYLQLPVSLPGRDVFSEVVKSCLLEEIRWHNPKFPVRRFFTQLLKKQKDYLALQDSTKPGGQMLGISLNPEVGSAEEPLQEEGGGPKRKRKASPGLNRKRRRATTNPGEEPATSAPSTRASRGRLSRASVKEHPPSPEPDVLIIEEEKKTPPDTGKAWEDVLWTEKYQPQSSGELIGNSSAIKRLHSWLQDWKIRAEKEEKSTQVQKTGKDKNDTRDMDDFRDGEDSDEEFLCNTVLITGPPGVGKTAAVYACAQELGFKVFEVNASCQRSGRQILAQLKEATQSHQVDQQSVSAHKPCFFNSYSKSPRKFSSPKKVVSSPRKPPLSPRGSGGKKGLAPKSLANFFKATPKPKTEDKKNVANAAKGNSKVLNPLPLVSDKGTEETQRKSATSLILFEEVDVIFDEDSGFLSAIKTFMSTTKRPVIMTTSDPMFTQIFDGAFEEITFHVPTVVNVASYLQVLCLVENLRTDTKDFITLLTSNKCDIRQSVLQLQFWACSGGGGLRQKELPLLSVTPSVGTSAAEEDAVKDISVAAEELPRCNYGCTENLLGLSNIIPPAEGITPFVKGNLSHTEGRSKILQLLVEFQCRKEDFISSNLEFLLPLPVLIKESHLSVPHDTAELAPPTTKVCPSEEDMSRVQVKRKKKMVLLDDSDLFESDSNSVEEILPVPRTMIGDDAQNSDISLSQVRQSAPLRKKLTAGELKSSSLVCSCLDSLATFADNMSYMDCCTCNVSDHADACNLNWTESRMRHGLCDGLRIETGVPGVANSIGEIRAHIEGLAFHRCSSNLTKTLQSSLELCKSSGHDPSEQITLHVPKAREEVYFGQPFTSASTVERRRSLVRKVFSSRGFSGLGNRQVNVTEYLPALRSICRLEKEKEAGKTKRRFLHYLEGIHLELRKETVTDLAGDFP
ncbi:ATPase family AAA domain-containing protein 5 isoform X2 [Hyperolius riggenbachi]|uniref:ATPase family AAA domain-containing protein 5 isoform X2 n=1 Tax=Hyperolius riggenbachi TaxID=752182 RepID=UPI0035A35209